MLITGPRGLASEAMLLQIMDLEYTYCISGFFRGYLSSRMYTVGLVRENLFSR